jgi:hypothetical protein
LVSILTNELGECRMGPVVKTGHIWLRWKGRCIYLTERCDLIVSGSCLNSSIRNHYRDIFAAITARPDGNTAETP